VHVVWEKFCRYFDVEPRVIPLQADKYTIGPEDVEPHVDENTIGVAAASRFGWTASTTTSSST
jgi:glutamate decarboxylase